jgi:hypothetical protein
LLQADGQKIVGGDGKVWCEIWWVKSVSQGPKTTEADVTWTTTPSGTLIGAIRWHGGAYDRRGQNLKAGVYTLRFGMFPINGDHQGVAPQRDFLVLAPAALDQNAETVAKFDDLMNLSRKASNSQHPAVMSMWLATESDFKPGLEQLGEHEWVLRVKLGDSQIALIVIGKAEA